MLLGNMVYSNIVIRCEQTIKCLLIVPNPESALNEEAGKMLLEQYDDYSTRARMFTEIHAKPPRYVVQHSPPPFVSYHSRHSTKLYNCE